LEYEEGITSEWKRFIAGGRTRYDPLGRLSQRQPEKEAHEWSRLSIAMIRVERLTEA
jgi:hypothetical protein